MTRSHRRPLVAGILAATAVLMTGLLSACGAGQIAQTSQVEPGVAGVNTQAPGGLRVFIRNAALDYNGPKGYPQGSNAPISLWIFNDLEKPITLVGVASRGQVMLADGKTTATPCSAPRSGSPTPPATSLSATATSASPSPSASPSGKPGASGKSGSPSAAASSAPPSLSPSPSPSANLGSATINVRIAAGGCVELTHRAAHYLQVVQLPNPVDNTQTLPVLFHFRTEDGQSFTIGTESQPVLLPIAVPESPLPTAS